MTTETRGRVRIEPATKRIRAFLGGTAVFDTNRPRLVWEGPHIPVYYIPAADVVRAISVLPFCCDPGVGVLLRLWPVSTRSLAKTVR